MRLLLSAAALVLLAAPLGAASESADPTRVPAGRYTVDPTHATVLAKVSHLGFSDTTVRLDSVSGSVTYDPARPEAASAEIAIALGTLNSGLALRDEHLRGPNWFDVAGHPNATFVSRSMQRTTGNNGTMTGDLTFRGVTRPVTLAVKFNGFGTGMDRKPRIGLSATGTVKRSDFGMTSFMGPVADEVRLEIEAEFAGN
jgi:polyisoprenoid-binding protein YceI